jgi:hypothetical protein
MKKKNTRFKMKKTYVFKKLINHLSLNIDKFYLQFHN